MRIRSSYVKFFVLSVILVSAVSGIKPASAQASLAAEDIIDEVRVSSGGEAQTFTLVRDARRREQWYYIPNQPRLYEQQTSGGKQPEFALIRYQVTDPQDVQKIIEGGILQFAVTLAAPDVLDDLRKSIRVRVGGDGEIRLAALPLKAAEVHIYSPQTGLLIASSPLGEGIAPVFATQKMVFSMPLTKVGADVYDALANGQTGVPVAVVFTYDGLTPAAGFSVKVNWDSAYEFYSRDSQFRAQASYFGWFGASYANNSSEIRDKLIQNHAIEVEATTDANFTMDKLDAYLQPLLKRINDGIVQAFQPPDKISPAAADAPTAGGRLGSVGYSVAMKSVSQAKHGSETTDMHFRSIVERKTLASGFIGVGKYPKEMRSKLITIVPVGPWKSAYFLTPQVGDDPELGITQVDLQLNLLVNGEYSSAQTIRWTPKAGWTDRNGTQRTVIAFPLLGEGVTSTKQVSFQEVLQITRETKVLKITRTLPSRFDESPVETPLSYVDAIRFNGDYLTFKATSPESHLISADISVEFPGGSQLSGQLRPYRINSQWADSKPLIFLMERPEGAPTPVKASVLFHTDDGKTLPWARNGADLRSTNPSLVVDLVDSDWKK